MNTHKSRADDKILVASFFVSVRTALYEVWEPVPPNQLSERLAVLIVSGFQAPEQLQLVDRSHFIRRIDDARHLGSELQHFFESVEGHEYNCTRLDRVRIQKVHGLHQELFHPVCEIELASPQLLIT